MINDVVPSGKIVQIILFCTDYLYYKLLYSYIVLYMCSADDVYFLLYCTDFCTDCCIHIRFMIYIQYHKVRFVNVFKPL